MCVNRVARTNMLQSCTKGRVQCSVAQSCERECPLIARTRCGEERRHAVGRFLHLLSLALDPSLENEVLVL